MYDKVQYEDMIIKYLPLVEKIAYRIDINQTGIDKDDLVSIGVLGLMDAIKKYDKSKKVPFEAYATLRIRGSIIDELRKSGPVSREKINKLNEYYEVKENLERQLLRTPSEREICKSLNIDQKDLSKLHETVHYLSSISLESTIFTGEDSEIFLKDTLRDNDDNNPEKLAEKKEIQKLLENSLKHLNERERILLNLYYVEELSLTEISYILEISIPRVSQIHGKTLLKLREIIKSQWGE